MSEGPAPLPRRPSPPRPICHTPVDSRWARIRNLARSRYQPLVVAPNRSPLVPGPQQIRSGRQTPQSSQLGKSIAENLWPLSDLVVYHSALPLVRPRSVQVPDITSLPDAPLRLAPIRYLVQPDDQHRPLCHSTLWSSWPRHTPGHCHCVSPNSSIPASASHSRPEPGPLAHLPGACPVESHPPDSIGVSDRGRRPVRSIPLLSRQNEPLVPSEQYFDGEVNDRRVAIGWRQSELSLPVLDRPTIFLYFWKPAPKRDRIHLHLRIQPFNYQRRRLSSVLCSTRSRSPVPLAQIAEFVPVILKEARAYRLQPHDTYDFLRLLLRLGVLKRATPY